MASAIAIIAALALAACDSVEERVEKHYARGMELLEQGEPVKATLEFRNALKLDENHPAARFQIARAYERDGDLRAALGNYRLAAELDPRNVEARIKLAQFTLLGGNPEEAGRYASDALTLAPSNPDALAVQAAALYRADDIPGALDMARKARAVDATHAGATAVLASERYAAGDPQAALTFIDAALGAHPTDLSLNLLKLRILEAEKDLDGLGVHLSKMIGLFPQEKAFKKALVSLRITQNDMDGAEKELRALADADPADAEAALDVVRFVGRRSGEEAGRAELGARIAAAATPGVKLRLQLALADIDFAAGDRQKALDDLRALVDGATETADRNAARLKLARYEVAADNRAGARTLLDAVLAEDAKNAEALTLRGALLLDEDRAGAAIADLLAAAGADPQNARIMLLLARAYERNGSPDLATERFAAATRASGYDPDIAIAYARQLQGRQQGPAAETVLSEAARRHPDSAPLFGALAELRLGLKDWEGAAKAAQELSALQGNDRAARAVEAASLGAQGRTGESIDLLQEMAADPETKQAAIGQLVGAYLRNGEIGKAEAFVDKALEEEPGDLRALLLRAQIHLARGDSAGAEGRLTTMVATAPDNAAGYVALARLHLSENRDEDAERILRDGVARVANPDGARLLLAQVLERRGAFDEAISEYSRLYETQSDSTLVANNLAALLAEHRAGDPGELARAARVAQRLRGSDVPEFQDTYGWILFLQGDADGALRSLVPAVQARPDNPWIRFHAGMAFARLGRVVEARPHLEAALSLDPAFPKAEETRTAIAGLPVPAQ